MSSVFDFCGSWAEEAAEGDSLVPLMREIQVSEEKIQQSLSQSLVLDVYIKFSPASAASAEPLLLTTVYRDGSNSEVSTSFEVDGKWKLSHHGETHHLSKCAYLHESKTLVLEKQVSSTMFLRDERRIERFRNRSVVCMRQRLELYHRPERPAQQHRAKRGIVAHRRWLRAADQSVFDAHLGRWELDVERSDKLEPFLRALNVRKPTFAESCVAQEIRLCGPSQLVFISEAASAVPNQTQPQQQRSLHTFVGDNAGEELVIKIGRAREVRRVHNGAEGRELVQRLMIANVQVTRYWKPAKGAVAWIDTLPELEEVLKPQPHQSSLDKPWSRILKLSPSLLPSATMALFALYFYTQAPLLLVLAAFVRLAAGKFAPPSVKFKSTAEGWIAIQALLLLFGVALFNTSTSPSADEAGYLYLLLASLLAVRIDLLQSDAERWTALALLSAAAITLVQVDVLGPLIWPLATALVCALLALRCTIAKRSGVVGGSLFRDQALDLTPPPCKKPAFAVRVPKVRLEPNGGGRYAEYLVEVPSLGVSVWRRYNQFDVLRQELRGSTSQDGDEDICFPGKTWTRRLGNKPFLEMRRGELNDYLITLFARHGNAQFAQQNHAVRLFLGLAPA